MPDANVLVTIAFSHYCEKARWALDLARIPYREDKHLPLFHLAFTKPRGGRSTPLLVLASGEVLKDSTDILDWVDRQYPIWPRDPEDALAARALEAQLDERFGPHLRRLAYYHLFAAPPALLIDFAKVAPKPEQLILRVVRPLAVEFIRRSLKIDEGGARRSETIVRETFAALSDKLASGRGYLVGDQFSAADLTFAALAAPLLFPEHHPLQWPSLERVPSAMRGLVESLRATPAGQHAMRMYAAHRPPNPIG